MTDPRSRRLWAEMSRHAWTALVLVIIWYARAADGQVAASDNRPPFLEPVKNPLVEPPADAVEGLTISRDKGGELEPLLRIYGDYPSTYNSLGRLMGNRHSPDFRDPVGKVVALEVLKNGDVLFGPNLGIKRRRSDKRPNAPLDTASQQSSPIDFYWDAQGRKLHTRSLILTENGDPADLAFRRSGDETYPYGPPMAIRAGHNLGTMYWVGWAANDSGFQHRSAQLYAKAAEDIASKRAGGSLHLATTPIGDHRPIDRLVISDAGNIGIGAAAPEARVHIATNTENSTAVAEDYPSREPLEAGDVVAIDPEADANALHIIRTDAPYDQTVIGVVVASPVLRVSKARPNPAAESDEPPGQMEPGYAVAHTGRATVKVSNENGDIRPGDYLTASSTPGVAMKATAKGAILGKALQAHRESSPGKIAALIDITWYAP
jgi:hypothetical protein